MTKATLPICLAAIAVAAHADEPAPNPLIDYQQFQRIVTTSKAQHESHRLTEAQFLAQMQERGVIVLDARTAERFRMRHIKGAVNLPFTEFTAATLARISPEKGVKILIYCNNNFLDSPAAFASKAPAASLNLSTYTSLKAYGYTNVYELGPLLRVDDTKIPFEGSEVGG
jgi:3-mercaptopyruvate sulfurtransferase SseA